FSLDAEGLIAASRDAKLLFICNPNNPTGTVNPRETIEYVIREADCMVVVDEAYFEFNDRESVQDLIATYDNLIVLRTFSKFAAIAGARVGYLLTNPYLASKLNAIRLPMGISYFSMEIAKMVLAEDMVWVEQNLQMILVERSRMQAAYTDLDLKFWPSRANFILVRFGERASVIAAALKQRGLVVRDYSQKAETAGCLRIGIRSPEENTILLEAVRAMLDQSTGFIS
ncbi:MAG TPA: histidinol-phosphate transaminase, partial [bacterium]|nr:histidinol-phosphate transaminase [bacterium]